MLVVGHDPASGRPLVAGDEDHCLVLGPPRSGKTTGKLVPSILTHTGPLVVASSKPDVLAATAAHRWRDGPVWIVSLMPVDLGRGSPIRIAAWSPLPGCADWDTALRRARSLTTARAGEGDESSRFFRTQAVRVLAALLQAAALGGLAMEDVARWPLLGDLDEPVRLLRERGTPWAAAVLQGIDGQDPRLRDSVLATASEMLQVYDSEHARRQASGTLLDLSAFLRSAGTVYVIAPSEVQEQFANIVVGFLDDLCRTAYGEPGVGTLLLVLDEADKIAPWPALPNVLGEGGSQGVQIQMCVQDLSQARARWGEATDGFPTLFRHKVLLPGVADRATLEGLSAVLGEEVVPGASDSGQRPLWPPHRLAAPPPGTAVHIDGVHAQLVRVVRHHDLGGHR